MNDYNLGEDHGDKMNKQEQDAFIHAFITTIGGVDENAVAAWIRGEGVDLPLKHIEILQEAKEFWTKAKKRIRHIHKIDTNQYMKTPIDPIRYPTAVMKIIDVRTCQLLVMHDKLGHWPGNYFPQQIQDAADKLGLDPQDPKFREQINKLAVHALNQLYQTSFLQRWEPAKNMWADGISKLTIAKWYGISEKALKTKIQKWRKRKSKISTYFPKREQDEGTWDSEGQRERDQLE